MNKNEEEEEKGQEENERVSAKSGDFRFSQSCHAILIQLKKSPPNMAERKKDKTERVKKERGSFSLEKYSN